MKYIVDIPDDRVCDYVGSTHLLMPYTMAEHKGHYDTGLNLTLYTEPDRKAIEDEVWEFVKKMEHEISVCDLMDIYGDESEIYQNFTYQEAKAKYEVWKSQREKLQAGDIVRYVESDGTMINAVVMEELNDDGDYSVFTENGIIEKHNKEELISTDKHFNTIEVMLTLLQGDI